MKLINIIVFLLISFNIGLKANSNNQLDEILKEGGKLIFIRHAYAPGGGDPDNFEIQNCATQRNLNKEGIAQSKYLGKLLLKSNIEPYKALSSEWCRCKQTTENAFKNYETKNFLNSFFSQKFANNKSKSPPESNTSSTAVERRSSMCCLFLISKIFPLIFIGYTCAPVGYLPANFAK